jgi:hypothetical protein
MLDVYGAAGCERESSDGAFELDINDCAMWKTERWGSGEPEASN